MAPLKLSENDTVRIIKLFKENPCLYNVDHESYNDASFRRTALDSIRESMGIPNATTEDIKKKLKSLRSTFMQEFKKVKTGQAQGQNYIPKLRWYKEMASFIPYIPANLNAEEFIENVGESENVASQPSNLFAENHQSSQAAADEPETRKRKREISQSLQEDDDDDTLIAFAQLVAGNLRKVDREGYFYLKNQIQNILYDNWFWSKTSGSPMRKKLCLEQSSPETDHKVILVKNDEYEAFSNDLVHQLRSLSDNIRHLTKLQIFAVITFFRTGYSASDENISNQSTSQERKICQALITLIRQSLAQNENCNFHGQEPVETQNNFDPLASKQVCVQMQSMAQNIYCNSQGQGPVETQNNFDPLASKQVCVQMQSMAQNIYCNSQGQGPVETQNNFDPLARKQVYVQGQNMAQNINCKPQGQGPVETQNNFDPLARKQVYVQGQNMAQNINCKAEGQGYVDTQSNFGPSVSHQGYSQMQSTAQNINCKPEGQWLVETQNNFELTMSHQEYSQGQKMAQNINCKPEGQEFMKINFETTKSQQGYETNNSYEYNMPAKNNYNYNMPANNNYNMPANNNCNMPANNNYNMPANNNYNMPANNNYNMSANNNYNMSVNNNYNMSANNNYNMSANNNYNYNMGVNNNHDDDPDLEFEFELINYEDYL